MSEWFKENRWLGTFLVVVGLTTLLALWFWWSAKSSAGEAAEEFNAAATERMRLERLDPFPNEANFRKLKVHIDNYAASSERLKEDLKSHAIAATLELKPNEFQTRLRQAMLTTSEKARASRVKLPENFALGFEEFTVGLPNTVDAPALGQQLAQAEMLANVLIDAHVEAISVFKRLTNAAPATVTAPPKKPMTNAPKLLERGVVDLTFTAAPSVMRRALNQIASSPQQFYIVRTIRVRNEKEKGPTRETAATDVAAAQKSNAALTFIVGNEHVETSMRVEMVRFVY